MSVVTLILSGLVTGRGLSFALICPEARYVSVACLGANRLERRHLSPVDWTGLECRIGEGLPPGPLPASHEVVRALLEPDQRSGQIVQYVSMQDVTPPAGKVVETLDAWLRRLASVKPAPR